MPKLSATQQAAVTAYGKFLDAGASYGKALRKAAAELRGTPCPTFLEALAMTHARKYKCNFTFENDRATFHHGKESTRETRQEAATKSWQRNVMVHFRAEKPAKPAKSFRVSSDLRALAKAYLANFDSKADAIRVLNAVASK